jgi:protein-disulfide isomerase
MRAVADNRHGTHASSVPSREIVMSEPTTPNKRERREAARAERQAKEQAAAAADTRRKRLLTLGGLLGAAVVVVVVLIVVSSGGGRRKTPSAASGGGATGVAETRALIGGIPQKGITLGRADAPVTIVEFADPQCPYCKQYTLDEMPKVVQDEVRTGKAKMELRLLTFIGPDSITAAQVINAAGNQNLLWNTADLMYRNQGEENSGYVTDAFLNSIVKGAGGDAAKAQKDAATPAVQAQIGAARTLASRYNVTGTPTILVGPSDGDLRADPESAPTAAGIARLVDAAAAKAGT